MTNIFRFIVIIGTQHWLFEDFRSATNFVEKSGDSAAFAAIYKLVYANGKLVEDGKR